MLVRLPGFKRSAANVAAIWLLQAGTLLFALVSMPLVTHRFGLEGLGVWLLVQQIASLFQLLELGLASSLGRILSRDLALHDANCFTEHTSSAITILLLLGGALIVLALPLGMAFPHAFELPSNLARDAVWMLAIAILATGLALPLRSALGILSCQHHFALLAFGDGLALILRVFLIIAACTMVSDHALIALSLAVFAPGFLGALGLFLVAARFSSYDLFKVRSVGLKAVRVLLEISLANMVVTLAAFLLRQGSSMLVGYSLSAESVPLIALPMMLVVSIGPFLGIANQLISPVASQMDSCNLIKDLQCVYLSAVRYTLATGLLIFIGIVILVPDLLPLWIGKNIFDLHQIQLLHINILMVFAGYCIATPAFLARSVLVSVGKHRIAAKGELFGSLMGIFIGWILMYMLGWGATGMACGIAIAYLLRAFGVLMRELALYFDMSLVRLYGEMWLRPLLSSIPLLFVLIPAQLSDLGMRDLALYSIPALALWAWFAFRLIVPASHREILCRSLRDAISIYRRGA